MAAITYPRHNHDADYLISVDNKGSHKNTFQKYWSWTKWLSFCRVHYQIHFPDWVCLNCKSHAIMFPVVWFVLSAFVPFVAWCHQSASRDWNLCWPRSITSHGVVKQQRANTFIWNTYSWYAYYILIIDLIYDIYTILTAGLFQVYFLCIQYISLIYIYIYIYSYSIPRMIA